MEYVELGLNTKMIPQMLSRALARARALTLELSCVMTNRPFWRKRWPKNSAVFDAKIFIRQDVATYLTFSFCFQCKSTTIVIDIEMNVLKF